ncbi:MAG: hypothetical protein CML79_06720 [Rhodobiaceae bacterium]|nr:hypothetical protein [Rhodobiaceae bacterium]HCQ82412.1 hypothetical protein [Rhodobiaceae bacterium]|tara:strand:+ start:2837 stop:3313 length:477 start_codon:yes stop_codon:yes gene_type:complete
MTARLPNYVLTTFAIVVVIIIIGLFDRQRQEVAEGNVGLVIGVPGNQLMSQSNGVIALPVVLRLVNRSDEDETLEAENTCKIFRFVVTTPENEFIQAKRFADNCPTQTAYGQIAADEAIEEIEVVPLDADRFVPGDYKLRVKFWNYDGEAEFSLLADN